MPHEIYDLPKGFDGTVRLFPLPDLVVFPGVIQGLHIFEARYCEMLEDALQSDRLITMATLLPGSKSDYYGRAEIDPAVCVGRVTAHQRKDDGTHDLALMGLCRAAIVEEMPLERAYRQATVQVVADCEPPLGESATQRVAAELAECLRNRVAGAESLVHEFLRGEISMGRLTDIIAFHLPLETKVKLQLLSRADVLQRAEALLEHLTQPARPRNSAGSFPPEFSPN